MHAYRLNHYEELGVRPDADAEAIRKAYRALAKQLHPDLSDSDGSGSKEAFLRLQEAYGVLSDPQRRARYDRELAERVAMAEAARAAAHRPIRPSMRPRTVPRATATAARRATAAAASGRPRRPSRILGMSIHLAAMGLVVMVTAGIVTWQVFFRPEPQQIVFVRVDADNRGHAARVPQLPADPGILTKEVDHVVQAQVERVEAAKKRLEAQLSELDARKPPPGKGAPLKTPAMLTSRVECIGRGTNVVLTRESDVAKVSYDNGPQVQPRVRELGDGTVLVSHIEPTNKIAVAFTKGDRNGTTLLMFDETGKVQQTSTIACTAAAF